MFACDDEVCVCFVFTMWSHVQPLNSLTLNIDLIMYDILKSMNDYGFVYAISALK